MLDLYYHIDPIFFLDYGKMAGKTDIMKASLELTNVIRHLGLK